jgi:hypothetical protein
MRRFILTLFVFLVLSVPAHAQYLYSYVHYDPFNTEGFTEVKYQYTGISIFDLAPAIIPGSELSNVTATIANMGPWEVVSVQLPPVIPGVPWIGSTTFTLGASEPFTWPNGFTIPESLIGEYESDTYPAGPEGLVSTLTIELIGVPEAATLILLCSGLIGLAGFRRKFKK